MKSFGATALVGRLGWWLKVACIVGWMGSLAWGQELRFQRDIAPVLRERCVGCHQAGKAKGSYRLDTFELLMKAGSSGLTPVVPGKPGESRLATILREKDEEDRMPQDAEALTVEEIGLVERWIVEGARYDGPDPVLAWVVEEELPEAPDRYGRPWPVMALAWNPEGTRLAVAGYREVRIHGTNGALLHRLGRMPERIAGLAWGVGERLAVAGGRPGRGGELWMLTGMDGTRQRLGTSGDLMLAVAFSPDGSRLLAGGTDQALSVYSAGDGRRQLHLPHHADWVTAVAWSPDGNRFGSASRDRTARVCSAKTGEGESAFTEHGTVVGGLVFGLEGKWIWSGGRDRRLRAWDGGNSEQKKNLDGWGDEVFAVVLGGGRIWAASRDGRVGSYRAEDGGKPREFRVPGERLTALAVSEVGRWIAVGTQSGRVQIRRMESEEKPVTEWRQE